MLEIEEFALSIFVSDGQQVNCLKAMFYVNSLGFQTCFQTTWEAVAWFFFCVHIKRSDTKSYNFDLKAIFGLRIWCNFCKTSMLVQVENMNPPIK